MEALEVYMQNPDAASLVFDGSAQHSAGELDPAGIIIPDATSPLTGMETPLPARPDQAVNIAPAAPAASRNPASPAQQDQHGQDIAAVQLPADIVAPGSGVLTPSTEIEQPEQLNQEFFQARLLAYAAIKKDTYALRIPGLAAPVEIVTAGNEHFKTLWTRDACFSMYGLVGDERGRKIMKDTLQTFLSRPNAEGQLPRRMGDRTNIELVLYTVFGLKTPSPEKLEPIEYNNELNVAQIDATALPVIQAYEYYKATEDLEFIRKNYYVLRRATAWLTSRSSGGLIDQPGSADWKDVMKRSGKVAYTNMLVYRAYEAMALLAEATNDRSATAELKGLAEQTKAAINKEIWNEKTGYYRDSNEAPDAFSPDGNALAIVYGVADKARTASIMAKFEGMLKTGLLPFPALDGEYPDNVVPFWMGLAGVRHYHDSFVWPWQGNVFAVAAIRAGRPDLAVKALNRVGAQAVKDGTFYEIYKMHKGEMRPVRTLIYKSEPNFLWSAGTYLWAYRELTQSQSAR